MRHMRSKSERYPSCRAHFVDTSVVIIYELIEFDLVTDENKGNRDNVKITMVT